MSINNIRLIMKVVKSPNDPTAQGPPLDYSKKVYECSICKRWFNWYEEASWYGSYKDLEDNPEKIILCCSNKCKEQHDKL